MTNWRDRDKAAMAAVVDLNGIFRGKRLVGDDCDKVMRDGLKMPFSIVGVDIWGTDIEGSSQVTETGDADGDFQPTGRGPLSQSWFDNPTDLLPFHMVDEDGTPNGVCPRGALYKIVERYRNRGLTIVAATELEFYLVKRDRENIVPNGDGRSGILAAVECIDALQSKEMFFAELYAVAEEWGISVGAAMSEAGAGQYEVNLNHQPDALKIADDTCFFKRILKGVAVKHGFEATFMAKPFGDGVGNGLHVHFSVLDENGNNIFNDGGDKGTLALKHALGGLEATMADFMTIFAPHANSFRRFIKGSFAPTKIVWGYDNRFAALRVPQSLPAARRIEHRVAGADVNPYLLLAAILGGALVGIENRVEPTVPVTGNAYDAHRALLPVEWGQSIDRFSSSQHAKALFDPRLVRMLIAQKEQERTTFLARIPRFEYDTYVDSV